MANRQLDEEAIFHVARKISGSRTRAEYLDQICAGDLNLRQRVEALLEVNEQEQEFLKSAEQLAPTLDQSVTEGPGTFIGRYKLLQKIGEGGFGVVFMAEQQSPVIRKVALKVIKPGMDSHAVVARFEAERQALALMDHANIAHILDGGVSESGRPYFVMELVRGLPITEYCDSNELSTEDRLSLFIDVCRAVQHAHQKGIIHRDLKPSNIMVTLHDGKPVPRVIDFGVSKALHQRLTEKTLFTAFGQMIGTAQYMSPEQAEMSGLDVDTRSDVYSLGVLLYELLTGGTPLKAETLRQAGYAEIQRIIKETEPPRPSLRLSTAGEKLTAIAKHRNIDPNALQQLIRGDLDWIVMKSLEKERGRRYESAGDFAADIQRFLDQEAVEAHPHSPVYRVRKFVRRHRAAVGTAFAVLAALVIGFVVVTTSLVQAQDDRVEAERARKIADDSRIEAVESARLTELESKARRRQQYMADMNVAMQALRESNVRRVLAILAEYRNSPTRGFEWYCLWHLCQKTLRADRIRVADKAHKVLFSPDHQTLAVAYARGSVELFDLNTLQPGKKFPCRRSEFYPFVAFSADGSKLAHASSDATTVVVQDLSESRSTQLPGHPGTVREVTFSPNGKFLAAGAGRKVVLWDLDRERIVHLFDHESEVWAVVFSPDGKLLASGTNDGVISIWDVEGGVEIDAVLPPSPRSQERKLQRIWSLAFSVDGKMLAAGCGDWAVRLYGCRTDNLTWQGHTQMGSTLAFGPLPLVARELLAYSVRMSQPKALTLLATLSKHTDEVRSVSFWPGRNVLASASRDGTVKLWNLRNYEEMDELKGDSFGGHSCAFSPSGDKLASAGVDYRVLIWDVTAGSDVVAKTSFSVAAAEPFCRRYEMAFLPNGCGVISLDSGERNKAVVRSTQDWTEQTVISEAMDIQCLAVSKDLRMAVGGARSVSLWDLNDSRKKASYEIGGVTSLVFNDKADELVVGRQDGSIIIQSLRDRDRRERMPSEHQVAVTRVAVSAEGRFLASGGEDGRVVLWDLAKREPVRSLPAHRDTILCIVFSPNGKLLATGAQEHERALCLWDLTEAKPEPKVIMSARSVYSLVFSPDGEILFAAHGDNTVRLWDVASGQQRLRLRGHTSAVQSIALSPDGRTLLSGDRYGTVRLWQAASPAQVADALTWWKDL